MKTLLFLVLSSSVITVFGQDYMLDKYENTYFHQRKEYTWKELGDVYMECEDAYNIYSIGRNNLNSAKHYANASGISLVGGISFLVLGPDNLGLIYGGAVLATGVLAGTGALIYLIRGKRKLRQAERVFNFEMMKRYGYKSEISLAFGATMNGVGLVLQF